MTDKIQRNFYASVIGTVKRDLANKKSLEKKVVTLNKQLAESQTELVRMMNAQKLLSTLSDDNTEQVLSFITGIVNKTLAEIFPSDIRRISLRKKLYAGSKPHIIVELYNGEDDVMDMELQNGTGLSQVVSFMYVICCIEIRKGRCILLMDEKLNGLHKQAKRVISEIIKIFAEGGVQFIFVEYSLNDLGKVYNVEKRGNESQIFSVLDGEYDDELVYMGDVDLSILDNGYQEVEEGLEEEKVIT